MLKLWDYADEIAAGQYRELAPLLVMLVDQPTEQTLQRERELILAEPDLDKRSDLFALAYAVASRSFDADFLRFVFRQELEQMQGANLLEEWVEQRVEAQVAARLSSASAQAREQGVQQGMQQGMAAQQREAILYILNVRFQLNAEQQEQITRSIATVAALEKLKVLFEHAVNDFALTDFLKSLQQTTKSTLQQERADEPLNP